MIPHNQALSEIYPSDLVYAFVATLWFERANYTTISSKFNQMCQIVGTLHVSVVIVDVTILCISKSMNYE